MTKMFSIMPFLYNEVGHFYAYNLAVRKAAHINGWEHFALAPKNCTLDLPEGWEKLLSSDNLLERRSISAKIIRPVGSLIPLIRVLKKIRNEKEKVVLFMEHFGLAQLGILCLATLFSRANYELWLLHRFEPTGFRKKMYHLFHTFLNVRLREKNLKILTDSDLLCIVQAQAYRKKVSVVPVPHSVMENTPPFEKKEILFWWPGGTVRIHKGRINKGLKYIQKLAKELSEMLDESICMGKNLVSETGVEKVQLLMAESAREKMPPAPIHFLKTDLPRGDYERWMKTVDLVLLPYLSENYRLRTSGIFVEAIVAGAIPVTTEYTWMSHELKRFQLNTLILDWQKPIYPQLQAVLNDPEIRIKIGEMRAHYEKFHSIENFAEALSKVMHS